MAGEPEDKSTEGSEGKRRGETAGGKPDPKPDPKPAPPSEESAPPLLSASAPSGEKRLTPPGPPSVEKKWWGVFSPYKLQVSKDSNYSPSKIIRLKEGRGNGSKVRLKEEGITEIQLQKYKSHYERYQFYMDISLKVIVSYYVVTAAILSFYVESPANTFKNISVLLPIVLGVVWGLVFLYGAYLWCKARRGILQLEAELIKQKLIIPPPDFHLLLWLLIVFGLLFLIVAALIFPVWWYA